MNGVHSTNPRISNILISHHGTDECNICGKATAKRKGKRPAPINLTLEFNGAVFRNNFASDNPKKPFGPAQIGVPICLARTGWESAHRLRIGASLCMACAKRLSSRLDAVIELIESRYRDFA